MASTLLGLGKDAKLGYARLPDGSPIGGKLEPTLWEGGETPVKPLSSVSKPSMVQPLLDALEIGKLQKVGSKSCVRTAIGLLDTSLKAWGLAPQEGEEKLAPSLAIFASYCATNSVSIPSLFKLELTDGQVPLHHFLTESAGALRPVLEYLPTGAYGGNVTLQKKNDGTLLVKDYNIWDTKYKNKTWSWEGAFGAHFFKNSSYYVGHLGFKSNGGTISHIIVDGFGRFVSSSGLQLSGICINTQYDPNCVEVRTTIFDSEQGRLSHYLRFFRNPGLRDSDITSIKNNTKKCSTCPEPQDEHTSLRTEVDDLKKQVSDLRGMLQALGSPARVEVSDLLS